MFKELFSSNTSTQSRILLVAKMIIAFILGILLAELFHLRYEYTAGVIAVLSLEPTRKRSLRSAILRILDSLLALGIAAGLFALLGYDFWVLLIFIVLLVPMTFLLHVEGGLVVALVLVSQVYLEQDIAFALNALAILGVSLSLAFLLNLYMPKQNRAIDASIDVMDRSIDLAIQTMAKGESPDFKAIEGLLKKARETLLWEIENHYFTQTDRRTHYLEVRQEQIAMLEDIDVVMQKIPDIGEKRAVLDFLKLFEGKIGKANYALELKQALNDLLVYFKAAPLPSSREAFEYRAELFHILMEMDAFLKLKLAYHEKYPSEKK